MMINPQDNINIPKLRFQNDSAIGVVNPDRANILILCCVDFLEVNASGFWICLKLLNEVSDLILLAFWYARKGG